MTAPPTTNITNAQWHEGWWRLAHRLDSPNFGPRPRDAVIDLVVVHSISLPPGALGGPHVLQLFTNQLDWDAHPFFESIRGLRVSSHFFINRSGVVWQLVSCNDRAWHAGQSHYRGRDDCNNDSVGIELEGLEGQLFDPAQYQTLANLTLAIAQHYPVQHIAGHEHIAPGRKGDPGSGFDWQRLALDTDLPALYFPKDVSN